MGLRVPRSLKERYAEGIDTNKMPYKKIFFICEGQITEKKYLIQLNKYKKELGIKDYIEIVHLEKTEEHKGYSNPEQLFSLANEFKEGLYDEAKCGDNYKYDKDIDKIVVVFDCDWEHYGTDSFDREKNKMLDLIIEYEGEYEIIITNPCIEIWLLMHNKSSLEVDGVVYEDIFQFIEEKEYEILQNNPRSNAHRYLSSIISKNFDYNCKNRLPQKLCLNHYKEAIEIEKKVLEKNNIQNISDLLNHISSNFGYVSSKLFEI